MAGIRNIAIRWYRKVFGAPAGSDIREQGLETVLDGNSAVALSEASISSHAVLGGTLPAATADAVWLGEVAHGCNLFGETLVAQSAEGPRGIVAAATGLALAGRRATAFLSGTDIAATEDLLISAAGKHAPLVLHLATRAAAAHGTALGSGHDTVHLSADAGFFMLFAANVQEAVDFTFIARRVAEESLVPGMVIMDGEQTALAAQDVRLPSPAQVAGVLGASRERIDTPTAAQQILLGETRRRVPAWHDLDDPALAGALFDRDSFALGAAARRPFFDDFVRESLDSAFEAFARRTGRRHDCLSRYRLDDAQTVLLAQGAATETARFAADQMREALKQKVGVLGLHALRPFPSAEIAAALEGREHVFVLERTDSPLSVDPPLTREVRAALERLRTNRHPGCSALVYGLGGLPLRVSDLIAACENQDARATIRFIGVAFDDASGERPKREVLLDALRRAYPDAAALGVRAATDATLRPQSDRLTIAIRRGAGTRGSGMLGAAGALLHRLEGGRVRSRPAVAWEHWSAVQVDWLTHGNEDLHDPGDDLTADIVLDLLEAEVRVPDDEVFRLALDAEQDDADEMLLGALFGALLERRLIEQAPRRVVTMRRNLLDGIDARRRDARVEAFQAGLELIGEPETVEAVARQRSDTLDSEAPAAVRHLGREDDGFASLPRFWDQAGVLYREGQTNRLTADPFLATGTMPPLSSTFNDTSAGRETLPVFDPALCTGCGKCWTSCPDSALGVVAATPAALIDAGISRTGADAVRQVSSKLASRIISSNRKETQPVSTFGELLGDAAAWLGDKMSLPEDRKRLIEDGIEGIEHAFGKLPVAITQPFFHDAEENKKDGAELLSIVVNPEACKSCGLCIESCEPQALSATLQDTALLREAHELWDMFSNAPDTASETVERVAADPDIGPAAAILLSRYCQFALAGGDPAEAGSGEKIAVKLALSTTEFHHQPLVQRFAGTLGEAADSITALIKQTLSGTLAVEDLDAITDKLEQTRSPRVDLRELAESVGTTAADHSIDTDYLLRLIDLSRRIGDAHHGLLEGAHGLGRARYGLAVAGGSVAAWAGAFPHNPFQAPVLVDMSGDAAQLAAGLIEGHLEETTELVRLLRLARLEIDQPDGAAWQREALASLRWQDLEKDELELCPPLVLVGSDEMLAGQGLSQLIWLLNSGLPVKVLVLSALDFGLLESRINNPRASLGLLALSQQKAFVAQTSVADPAHFSDSMHQALRFGGPALLQAYAPSPSRHGFPSEQTLLQAQLATGSRALPLFRYDPRAEGVFGLRISLDGNPDDGERPLTLADWALGQRRFAAQFTPLPRDAASPTPLHEWLQLDAKARTGKTSFVAADDGDDERRFAVSPALADAAGACLGHWQTLRELAGVETPFTERLEQSIRAEVAAEHRAELDAQKKASAAEIRAIREQTQVEIAAQIRSRLLKLATRKGKRES